LWDSLLAEQRDQRAGIDPDEAARLLTALAEPRRADAGVVRHFERALDAQRRASRLLRPADLIGTLTPSYGLTGQFRRDGKPLVRRELLRLRSEYAQFIGRMHHDAGDHAQACRWSDASLSAATQAGDGNLVAFTLARRTSLAAAEGEDERAAHVACTALAVARRTGAVRAAWQLRLAGLLDEAVRLLDAVGS
jgi:hypothetical protein